jgi:hypothetical protein
MFDVGGLGYTDNIERTKMEMVSIPKELLIRLVEQNKQNAKEYEAEGDTHMAEWSKSRANAYQGLLDVWA